mgnify:CR=1 FL=1
MQKRNIDLLKIGFILIAFVWFLSEIIKTGLENIRIYQIVLFISCILALYEKIKDYRKKE